MNMSADGLGSVAEFSAALTAAELAFPPEGTDAEAWSAALPFSGAATELEGEMETLSQTHGKGVKAGMTWLRQREPPKPPKGAWKTIWGSFCASLHEPGAAREEGRTSTALWEGLVAWHAGAWKRHKEMLAERSAANLGAASLPPLRSVPPVTLFSADGQ